MPRQHTLPRAISAILTVAVLLLSLAALPAAASEPAPAAVPASAPPGSALPALGLSADSFTLAGQPFEIRGVNYIRPTASDPDCPELHFGADGRCPWDQAAIDADMERLRALGVNTVRIFLNYYVFGGARASNASYNAEPALRHLEVFIESANRRGIYVLPVLLAKYPQDRFRAEEYEQAASLHIGPVVSRFAGHPGILGWDLFNEPDIGSPIDQRCWDWDNGDFPLCAVLAEQRAAILARMVHDVRWLDPERPLTISMAFAKSYFRPAGPAQHLAAIVDFYSFHYYDDDPYDSGRYAAHWYYGEGFPRDLRRSVDELHALAHFKPVLITELGFPSGEGARRDEAVLRRDLAQGLVTSREALAAGVLLWPFQPTPEALVGDLFLPASVRIAQAATMPPAAGAWATARKH